MHFCGLISHSVHEDEPAMESVEFYPRRRRESIEQAAGFSVFLRKIEAGAGAVNCSE
jgi:hypothetical protein